MKINVGFTLDEELILKIDERRNRIPRSSYVNEMLWENIDRSICQGRTM